MRHEPIRRTITRLGALCVCLALANGCGGNNDTPEDMGSETQDMSGAEEMGASGDMSSEVPDMSADMQASDEDMEAGEDMPTPQLDPCEDGEYVADGACEICPPGTENEAGDDPAGDDTECEVIVCDKDEFVSGNACEACPKGSTNEAGDDASRDDTMCDAILCEQNTYVDSNECTRCPGDTVNAAGDDASGPDTQCAFLCDEDEHVVSNVCVMCPDGSTNEEGDDPSMGDTMCDVTLCEEDEYVSSNKCEACPAGTSSASGADPTGADTMCGAILCEEDEYVLSNTCTMCAAGEVNEAGDDASGADTMCDAILCEEDEYVLSNACAMCPAGTTNEAGDDASSANTMCDAILCAEDEYVLSNVCTMCAAGEVNEAGDDASGADTSCVALCAEDEYVSSGVCTQCVGDTTNVAGDTPLGPDTVCDDVCSMVFGLVCEDFHDAYIKPDDTLTEAVFGSAVDMDGDRLVVGARYMGGCGVGVNPTSNPDGCADSGAVYVFERSNGVWAQTALLKASNTDAGDQFGLDVVVDGDTIVVGSRYEDSCAATVGGDETDNTCSGAGAAYVFEHANGAWSQTAYLKPSNAEAGDNFGNKVSASGSRIAVGSVYEDGCGSGVGADASDNACTSPGAVFVFAKDVNGWAEQAYIKSDSPRAQERFGQDLELDGDRLVVGAGRRVGCTVGAASGCNNGGAAYVYDYANGAWSLTVELKPSNLNGGDRFGEDVALDGDRLLISARQDDSCATTIDGDMNDNNCPNSGAAHLYEYINGAWTHTTYFKSSATANNALFGTSSMIDGDRIIIGASNEDYCNVGLNMTSVAGCTDTGAVYIFEYANGAWGESGDLKSNLGEDGDKFGSAIAISGDNLASSSVGEDSCAVGVDGDETDNLCANSGAVNVYRLAP